MILRDRILSMERVPANTLVPHDSNWRTHGAPQQRALATMLAEIGFAGTVLARRLEDGRLQVIDGHLRQKLAGDALVPVVVTDLNEDEARKLLATYDSVGAMAGTDVEALQALLEKLADDDANASDGLKDVLEKVAATYRVALRGIGLTDPDEVLEPPKVPKSKLGDLYVLGRNRLLVGDATNPVDVARLLNGEKPFLMLTDPPYGVSLDMEWRDRRGLNGFAPAAKSYMRRKTGHENTMISGDTRADWSEAFELVPSLTVAYVWHASLHSIEVGLGLQRIGFVLAQEIIWDKTRPVIGRSHYGWAHEPAWYARKKGSPPFVGPRNQSTIWEAPSPKMLMSRGVREEKADHPTQKPARLYEQPIENHLHVGELFYEPFGGSGTGVVAAEATGRRCFAMEIDPVYADVIVSRWERFTGRKASLELDVVTSGKDSREASA